MHLGKGVFNIVITCCHNFVCLCNKIGLITEHLKETNDLKKFELVKIITKGFLKDALL